MKEYPALIEVKLFFNGQLTYNENLCFRAEPANEDIIAFVKLIRPTTKIDYVLCDYIRPLKEIEK